MGKAEEIGACDFCGARGVPVILVSDGADSGESDWYCHRCLDPEAYPDTEDFIDEQSNH